MENRRSSGVMAMLPKKGMENSRRGIVVVVVWKVSRYDFGSALERGGRSGTSYAKS
jgi:hypothetical protein